MATQVLIASIKHETNTFSDLPADLAAFHARYCYRGEEIPNNMRGTKVEMAAFFDAAERHGWSLTYPIGTSATPLANCSPSRSCSRAPSGRSANSRPVPECSSRSCL